MKIAVALITSHKKARVDFVKYAEHFLDVKHLPTDLQDRVTFEALVFDPQSQAKSLEQTLSSELLAWDAVAMLIDESWAHETRAVRNAYFVGEVQFPDYVSNLPNLLSSLCTRLLKNFGALLLKLEESVNEQAASLPLRNFIADDLAELGRVCRELSMQSNFRSQFEPLLAKLVARRGPKRRSEYPTLYFKDDKQKHFEYGKEHHAQLGTGAPHKPACQINGNMRFGKRIDSSRHFNVTQGEKDKSVISGNFPNCHDQVVAVKERTHLNMFSNDFH